MTEHDELVFDHDLAMDKFSKEEPIIELESTSRTKTRLQRNVKNESKYNTNLSVF